VRWGIQGVLLPKVDFCTLKALKTQSPSICWWPKGFNSSLFPYTCFWLFSLAFKFYPLHIQFASSLSPTDSQP
jgi:hypothetical protein